MRSPIVLLLLLALSSEWTPAAEDAPTETPAVKAPVARPVFVRRYGMRVRADSTELASGVAHLTEQVFGRIEKVCELPVASEGEHSLEILVAQRKGLSGRNLFAQEGDGSRRGQQRLLIKNAAITEHESFMENCAWLALNRAIRIRQPDNVNGRTVHAPDWLAIGIAQDSEGPLRIRNGAVMRAMVRAENIPHLDEILKWTHMPDGRWSEKAVCGRLIRWMFSQPHHEKRLAALLTRAGRERGVTLEAVAEFMGMESTKAVRDAWLNWALAEDHRIRQPGMMSLADLDAFRGLLIVDPTQMDVESDQAFPRTAMQLADLVSFRDRDWLSAVLAKKKQELEFFATGRGQALVNVAAAYSAALDLLAARASEKKVLTGLRDATVQFEKLDRETRGRSQYFDDIERRYDSASRDLIMQSYAPKGSLERSPHQRYIDDFERRF